MCIGEVKITVAFPHIPAPGASDSSSASTIEESLAAQEEFALAAMKALYHVVCESIEAVNSVLGGQQEKNSEKQSENRLHQPQSKDPSSTADSSCDELQSHTPLLKKLFQLVDLTFVSNACQKESMVNLSLKTLCALAERAEESQVWRYTSGQDSFFTYVVKWHQNIHNLVLIHLVSLQKGILGIRNI